MTKRAVRPVPASFDQIAAQMMGATIPNEFTVVSLFSGCGGMDMGFLGGFESGGKIYDRLPFRVVWANDLNKAACETYERNLGHTIHQGDVWELLDTLPDRADLVIGGFPCQDVSINGKLAGVDGKRTGLYRAMVEAVSRLKPKMFVAENVKGLLSNDQKPLKQVTGEFEALGYEVSAKLYLAADYGVPQMRERVFIVGTSQKDGIPAFVHPEPPLAKDAWVTAKDAIGDLENVPESKEAAHIWSRAATSGEQGNRKLKADKPATTIRAECHGNIQFHYKKPRRISMREAARIQTFPDNFTFQRGLRETERMVGNAVPPVLAWHVACAVREHLL